MWLLTAPVFKSWMTLEPSMWTPQEAWCALQTVRRWHASGRAEKAKTMLRRGLATGVFGRFDSITFIESRPGGST